MTTKILISKNVRVLVDDTILDLLHLLKEQVILHESSLDNSQLTVIKQMLDKNLLIKRRKNGQNTYQLNPGITWE